MIEGSQPTNEPVEKPQGYKKFIPECNGVVYCGGLFYVFRDGDMQVVEKKEMNRIIKTLG